MRTPYAQMSRCIVNIMIACAECGSGSPPPVRLEGYEKMSEGEEETGEWWERDCVCHLDHKLQKRNCQGNSARLRRAPTYLCMQALDVCMHAMHAFSGFRAKQTVCSAHFCVARHEEKVTARPPSQTSHPAKPLRWRQPRRCCGTTAPPPRMLQRKPHPC